MSTAIAPRPVERIARPAASVRTPLAPWALAAYCLFLFVYGIGQVDLYRTEGLRALLGEECLRSEAWVVPRLYGEPLLTKPPGMYVAVALASAPFGGVSTVTARLPSVVAALITVLLFYWTFGRCCGRRAGLIAAAVLPTSFMWLERTPTAEIDLLQLGWVAGSLCLFLRGLEAAEENTESRWAEFGWLVGALLCVAGGVLTKWTAAAFFYLAVTPLLCWRGRLRLLWGWPHLAAAGIGAFVCLGWAAAAVAEVGWPVFRDTVGREALQRLSPMHHPRAYPWGELLTFPLEFLAANLPWSAVAILAFRPGFAGLWDVRGRRLLQLLQCWMVVNLLFWTFVPGHRPRHAMPLQPGLAGLAALVWFAWVDGRLRWPWLAPTRVLLGLLGLWIVVKLAYVHVVLPDRDRERHTRATGEALAGQVPGGERLFLCNVKDEGILFYYGRPAQRLGDAGALPRDRAVWCLLTDKEWRDWPGGREAEVVLRAVDEQGGPLVLVRAEAGGSSR